MQHRLPPVQLVALMALAGAGAIGALVLPRIAAEPTTRAAEAPAAAPVPAAAADPTPLRRPRALTTPGVEDGAAPLRRPRRVGAAPAPAAATPAPTAKPAAAPAPAPAPAAEEDAVEGDAVPQTAPGALPPIVRLRAHPLRGASTAALARRVVRSRRIVLSPEAQEAIADGTASAAALALVVQVARGEHEGPVLVHRIGGRRVDVQATTNVDTSVLVRGLGALGPRAAPTIRLQPVAASFADEARGSAEAAASGTIGAQAVSAALRWLGTPYSWGGGNAAGPTLGFCGPAGCQGLRTVGFDCSGLMLYAYAQVGITLDHYAAFQFLEGRRIEARDLMPGDLVFFHPKPDGPGHVGMYIGDGDFVEAPRTGDVVKITPLAARAGSYLGAVRPY